MLNINIGDEQNGCHFADDIFKYFFLEWQLLYLASYFTEICSKGSYQLIVA